MLLQSTAMVAKKLTVDDKITAYTHQTNMSPGCKVSNKKTLSGETFCFLEKLLLSIIKFCASSDLLFFY